MNRDNLLPTVAAFGIEVVDSHSAMQTQAKSIALVEDDELIRENYTEILEDEGYRVSAYADRATALAGITTDLPDLAILDIGLGREREGGILLCEELRARSASLPIIFLTSYETEEERVAGMRCEVDDYIVKGESVDYLIVRIATLFRRLQNLKGSRGSDHQIVEQGDLRFDLETSVAFWQGKQVNITLSQYWMLKELALRPGHAKSASKLMSVANMVVEPNTISANIKTIRKRFREIDPDFDHIKAEYGAGYRWV